MVSGEPPFRRWLIWVKFSKMKVKIFNNDIGQHLSIAIFHVKNGLTHNCCEFYKWEWLIHVRYRTKNYTSNYERSWYIDQDENTYTNGTWKREHDLKNTKITNFRTQVILHSTCVVFDSIAILLGLCSILVVCTLVFRHKITSQWCFFFPSGCRTRGCTSEPQNWI